MLQKEQLENMKVEEIREVLKDNGLSYHKNGKRITKKEMIDKYLDFVGLVDETENEVEELKNQIEEEEKEKNEEKILERKKKYVEQANIGTIVAFRLPNGRVISAAITKKSTKNRRFLVETKYGAEYKISFDDVLWARTNKRWPKGIYLLFKQNKMRGDKNGQEIC